MSHYSSPILFNISKKGKIKTYEEGSILDVRMLPSFEEFVNLIKGTLLNFLEFLYRNKDNEEDKQKYSLLDKKPRGMFEATARKTIPLGTTVSNRQIYIKEQFVHLYTRSRNFKKINDFLKQIEEYKRIKKRIKDSNDYRRVATCYNELGILYLKIEDVETAYANFLEIKKICEEHNIKDLKNTANYNIACYYSLKNELEKASKFLKLTKDDPKLNELAKTDKHLENLRNDSTFHSLFDK